MPTALRFRSAPCFYAIASSRPIDEMVDERTRAIYELGLDSLQLSPTTSSAPPGRAGALRRAAWSTCASARGLYHEKPGAVEISDGVLYRARVDIPARVPVGRFTAETFLIRDGRVLAVGGRGHRDPQIGLRALRRAVGATQWSVTYGLVAVALSVAARLGRGRAVRAACSEHGRTANLYQRRRRVSPEDGRWTGRIVTIGHAPRADRMRPT